MLFVDVGANLGTFTAAARAVGADTISIEPQPILQAVLRANAGDGKVIPVGVGTSNQKMRIYGAFMRDPKTGGPMANLGGNDLIGGMGRRPSNIEVDVKPLDELLEGTKPDVIKIDVEEMEKEVLQSGIDTIREHKPLLYLEQNRGHDIYACFRMLKPLGYRIDEVLSDGVSSTVIRYAADS